jgi:multidrug efflux pump subunit AcrA (membrane-fusion protein)
MVHKISVFRRSAPLRDLEAKAGFLYEPPYIKAVVDRGVWRTVSQTARLAELERIVLMILTNRCHGLFVALLILTVGFATSSVIAESTAGSPQTTTGFTRPSKKSKVAFPGVGIVNKIPVKEGEVVKSGQLLMNQLDTIEQKELELLQMQAKSTAKIRASEFDLEVKKVVLERRKKMIANNSASLQELEEAQLNVNLAEKNLEAAREEKEQAAKKAEAQQAKIDQMKLLAPFNGQVLKITANLGEASGPQSQDGAITIVDNSTLWIDVPELPTHMVDQLKMDQVLEVKYAQDTQWQKAKVIYFAPEADPGGQTRMFRLELANANNAASGQQVSVKLPDNLAQARAPQQDATAQAAR